MKVYYTHRIHPTLTCVCSFFIKNSTARSKIFVKNPVCAFILMYINISFVTFGKRKSQIFFKPLVPFLMRDCAQIYYHPATCNDPYLNNHTVNLLLLPPPSHKKANICDIAPALIVTTSRHSAKMGKPSAEASHSCSAQVSVSQAQRCFQFASMAKGTEGRRVLWFVLWFVLSLLPPTYIYRNIPSAAGLIHDLFFPDLS